MQASSCTEAKLHCCGRAGTCQQHGFICNCPALAIKLGVKTSQNYAKVSIYFSFMVRMSLKAQRSRYHVVQVQDNWKKHSSANVSVLVSLLLSPSLENQSTANLLLWRDGRRLHLLLLPSQCLQRKCGVGMGTWKRNNKWTKWTVLGTMKTKQ